MRNSFRAVWDVIQWTFVQNLRPKPEGPPAPQSCKKHPNFERLQNAYRCNQRSEIGTKGSPLHRLLAPTSVRLLSRKVAEQFHPLSGGNLPKSERITIWNLSPGFWALLDCKVLQWQGRDRDCTVAWDVCFKLLFELSRYVEWWKSCCSYMEDRFTVTVKSHQKADTFWSYSKLFNEFFTALLIKVNTNFLT